MRRLLFLPFSPVALHSAILSVHQHNIKCPFIELAFARGLDVRTVPSA